MEAPMGAVRDLLSRESRKAVGVRVPLLPPMDARKGALNRLESGDCLQGSGGPSPSASANGNTHRRAYRS